MSVYVISVLYVDDELAMLDIMKMHLEASGRFTVDTADSAHKALQKLKENQYDAVLSDYQMPGMDGIAFLKAVRTLHPQIPFIIFTGRGRENVVIDALNFGADFYLQKGSDFKSLFAELQNMIGKAVERKRLQDALLESEARYREFFTTSRDGVFITTPDGMLIDFNEGLLEISGFDSREALKRKNVNEFYPDEDFRVAFHALIEKEGYVKDYPVRGTKRGGEIIDVLITTMPVRNPDGSVKAFVGTMRDVTERKRAERALRESEGKLRSLFEHSLDGIFLTIPDGRILAANPAACHLLGYTEEEICKGGRDMIVDTTDPRLNPALEERQRNGKAFAEMNFVHRDGTKIPCEVSSNVFTDSAGNQMTSIIIRDISQRKRAEIELQESQERYRVLADNAPVGILTCDRSGHITYLNPKMLELLGSPGAERTREINLLHFQPLVDVGFSDDLRKTLDTGVPTLTREGHYTSKWGKTSRFRLHISPLWDHGSVKGAQVILDDVTSRMGEEGSGKQ